jgi:serine protease Do
MHSFQGEFLMSASLFRRRPKLLGAGLLAFALATTALTGLPSLAQDNTTTQAVRASVGGPDFADVAQRVGPAVVRVIATAKAPSAQPMAGQPGNERFGRRGGAEQQETPRRAQGQGSGFIIDAAGFIVTNAHVVGNAATVRVELADGRDLAARVVGSDAATDVALLKVEADKPLPTVAFANSDQARVGEWLMAMGNPFGLGGSVTVGVLSARGRQIGAGPYDDFLQTDAPINPGNSGGPLFNAEGRVVGVNTAIYSPSGGNVGIGFAVPANMVTQVVAALRDKGVVERGWLGVSLQPLDAALAGAMRTGEAKGALVSAVEADSPAAKAGIQAGDVITRIGARPVTSPRDLAAGVAQTAPGSNATVALLRDGEAMERQVAVGLHPASRQAAKPAEASGPALGLALAPRAEGGVAVTRVAPGSRAAEAGLREGDVILRAGGRETAAPQDVAAAVEAARKAGNPAIALQVARGEARRFVAVPIGAA